MKMVKMVKLVKLVDGLAGWLTGWLAYVVILDCNNPVTIRPLNTSDCNNSVTILEAKCLI